MNKRFSWARLRGKIREKGYTEQEVSRILGLTHTTLSGRLNSKSCFTIGEIEKLIRLLDIEDEKMAFYFLDVYPDEPETR